MNLRKNLKFKGFEEEEMKLSTNSQNTQTKPRGLITVLKNYTALPVLSCKGEV